MAAVVLVVWEGACQFTVSYVKKKTIVFSQDYSLL